MRTFEYPSSELDDLKKLRRHNKMNGSEKVEYKLSSAPSIANFMYKINKLNDGDIGTLSMKNIRKIFLMIV